MPIDVITMANDAFKSLETRINRIAGFVTKAKSQTQNKDPDLSEVKLSTEELCDIIAVNGRTLQ